MFTVSDHRQKRRSKAGFTTIELVVILIIVALVSTFAASRFFALEGFQEAGFFEEALTAVRYAQKFAITSGCDVRVTFTGTGYALEQWDGGGNACDRGVGAVIDVNKPGGGSFSGTAPTGISVTAVQFVYNRIGIPLTTGGAEIAGETTVTVGDRTLSIAPQTGFVRCTVNC